MIKTYFISIVRSLWKNRVTSIINVLGLTLGLTSILFLYVFLKYEKSFDTDQPLADRIYRINLTMDYPNRLMKDGNTESMLVKAVRNEFPDLEGAVQIIGPKDALVAINPNTRNERVFEEKRNIFFADSAFLKFFDYDFIAGNPRTALDDPNSIVLSTELVEKYYPAYEGRELDLIGEQIGLYDSIRAQITGIIDSPPSNSNFPFKALISSEIYYRLNAFDVDNWGNIAQGLTFVVLKQGQSPEEIEQGFPALVKKYRSESDAEMVSYSLLNLKELHSTSTWGFAGNYTTPKPMEIGFIAVGLFILISACINFVNLQTAQSVNRSKEVGIRKVLGGHRLELIVQFLVETAILTSIAFLLALWITELALDSWNGLLTIVQMNMQLDWTVVVFGLALIVFVTLIAGIYPAFKLSSFQPSETLRRGFSSLESKVSGMNLRQILVVTQFVITQTLIIGTIVVAFQMDYFLSKDLGFDKEGVINVTTYKPDRSKIDRLVQGLESMPEISSFSISSGPPLDAGMYGTSFIEVGHEDKGDMKTRNKFIDHRYLDHFKIQLAAGRNFRADEYSDTISGFIVNEAFVRQLEVKSVEEAIGKPIRCYRTQAPIVGVTQDFHIDTFSEKISPLIMFPWHVQANGADVRVAESNMVVALDKMRALWLEVFPNRAFEYKTVDDFVMRAYIVENIMFKTIKVFAVLAIIIGCLGLYGLVSFMAVRKTKEIGIRKVLGASYGQILYIFSRKFYLLILVAFVISVPLGVQAMELWLSNYAFRIPLEWNIFGIAFAATMVLTTVTVGYISYKTSMTNPAETLQVE